MVQLAVRYDKNLKDNVFVVRDDETYVSSTKTVVTVSEPYFPTIEGQIDYLRYRVDVTIDVLRETGTSKVVLYDGENVLDALDWEGLMLTKYYDFPIGTAHTLMAMFMGNEYCLKSRSKSFDVFVDHTAYPTQITYDGSSVIKTATTFDFILNSQTAGTVHGGTLAVSYTDGVHNDVQEVTVANDGTATVDFGEGLADITRGLFNISAVYGGTEDFSRAVLDFQVSKFYNVYLNGYMTSVRFNNPKFLVGESYILVGSIVDFFGRAYDESDKVKIYGYTDEDWELIDEGYTDNDGKFQITIPSSTGDTYEKFRFGTHQEYGFTELNPVLTPEYLYIFSVTPSYTIDRNGNCIITVQVVETHGDYQENLPVRFSYNGTEIYVGLTDSQGKVVYNATTAGLSSGEVIGIQCGDVTTSYTITTAITEYIAPNWKGQELRLNQATKQALSTGMKYTANNPTTNNSTKIYPYFAPEFKNKKQKFSFTVVSADASKFIYSSLDEQGNINMYGYPSLPWMVTGDTCEYLYDPKDDFLTCTVNGNVKFRERLNNALYVPCIANIDKPNTSIILNNIKHELIP